MIEIVCDFETRSRLDINETNTYKYARHSSTEVLCMSYSTDSGQIQLWRPGEPFPFADQWPDDGVYKIVAFNAEFEFAIWNHVCVRKYTWPKLPVERVDCLAARSGYAGLPRNLGDVSKALGLGAEGKDKKKAGEDSGHANLMRLTKPVRGKKSGCEYIGGGFDNDPARHERNFRYCKQDTSAELLVHRITPALPEAERELWQVHQRINERGVPVDVDLCRNAISLVEREKKRLCEELLDVTDYMVRTPNCIKAFVPWARKHGYPYPSLAEECVTNALQHSSHSMSPACIQALTIRKLYRNSAVSKYPAMLNHAESDGRCRAAHVFYKAGPGRFAGMGVNFLNLRRMLEHEVPMHHEWADRISAADEAELDDIYEELRATEEVDKNGVTQGGVIPQLGAMVRTAVCARPGYKLVDLDFKSIEYRKLHWLAGDERELKCIRDFDAGIGLEPYVLAAASIYQKKAEDVTKAERQIGKVQRLGAGYLAGAQTFAAFCGNYGIDMPLDRANEIVQHYRRSNPMVKKFWYDAGRCAVKAVETGQRIPLRHIEFFIEGHTLNIKLPCGRLMKYYDATVVDGAFGPEIAAMDQRTVGVKVVGLPILIENIDQGSSRDLLAGCLIGSDLAKLPVVLHVYDSIMMEVPEYDNDSEGVLTSIMRETPKWAEGLPLSTDVKTSRRMT